MHCCSSIVLLHVRVMVVSKQVRLDKLCELEKGTTANSYSVNSRWHSLSELTENFKKMVTLFIVNTSC